ncbi:YrrS family protein [Virgibacillus sp. W0181]|uniref:YrrS family protein n=1 Tax=Virgibacillus sp. W0181 TaxID=3391581 RepID=UPI003F48C42C
MSNFDQFSRVDKFEKRRKNTKAITVLLIVGFILSIVLLYLFFFGGKADQATTEEQQEVEQKPSDSGKQTGSRDSDEQNENERPVDNDNEMEEAENDVEENDNSSINREPVESDDANVIEAYTANWRPIGTKQTEPHTVQYEKGTQDWAEMEKALAAATDLTENNMVTYWIGNGGEQKSVGTIYNSNDHSEIYRVTIEWVDNEGWKPIQVEILKELAK